MCSPPADTSPPRWHRTGSSYPRPGRPSAVRLQRSRPGLTAGRRLPPRPPTHIPAMPRKAPSATGSSASPAPCPAATARTARACTFMSPREPAAGRPRVNTARPGGVGRPAARRWPALSRGSSRPAGSAAVRDNQVRPGASRPAGLAEPQSRRVLGRQPRSVPHMMPGTRIVLVEVAALPAALGADSLPAAEGAGLSAVSCAHRGVGHQKVLSAAGLVVGGRS